MQMMMVRNNFRAFNCHCLSHCKPLPSFSIQRITMATTGSQWSAMAQQWHHNGHTALCNGTLIFLFFLPFSCHKTSENGSQWLVNTTKMAKNSLKLEKWPLQQKIIVSFVNFNGFHFLFLFLAILCHSFKIPHILQVYL